MKKVLTLCLALVMIFSTSISAFAAGSFVSSPSGNSAPTLVVGKNQNPDCKAGLKITSYSNRSELGNNEADNIKKAYTTISNTNDITKLNSALANLTKELGISGQNLKVSDLFNIGCEGCDNHDGHGSFDIKLSAETLADFVGLMRFDGTSWHLVEGAKVEDGHLIFTSKELGAFAILVDTSAEVDSQTGDNSNIYFWIMVCAGSALVVVFLIIKKRRA